LSYYIGAQRRAGDEVTQVGLTLTEEQSAIVQTVRNFMQREVAPYESAVLQRAARGGHEGLTGEIF
jgi:hypothetical protein